MDKIVIFEPDDAARDRLEHLLVSAHLSDYCILPGRPDHAGITIWIGMEQDQPPGALNIRENDALRKPLRGGRLLDRIQYHIQEYSQKTHNSEQKIGNYQLKPAENTLKNEKTGEITYLTDKEKHILVFLLQKHPSRPE